MPRSASCQACSHSAAANSEALTGTIGGGQNLAVGETSAYQAGPLPDLEEERREMADVMYSTPGVPHVAHTASIRDSLTAAGNKQVRPVRGCTLVCIPGWSRFGAGSDR